MKDISKFTFTGYINFIKRLKEGGKVVVAQVSSRRDVKDKDTEEWTKVYDNHPVRFLGKKADFVEKYISNKSFVCVNGEVQSNKWTDERFKNGDGESLVRYEEQFIGVDIVNPRTKDSDSGEAHEDNAVEHSEGNEDVPMPF